MKDKKGFKGYIMMEYWEERDIRKVFVNIDGSIISIPFEGKYLPVNVMVLDRDQAMRYKRRLIEEKASPFSIKVYGYNGHIGVLQMYENGSKF